MAWLLFVFWQVVVMLRKCTPETEACHATHATDGAAAAGGLPKPGVGAGAAADCLSPSLPDPHDDI